MIIKSAEELRAFYEEFARMFGANEEEKVIFAECFLRADLRGKDTQGIAVIPLMYPWFQNGGVQFGTPFCIIADQPSFAIVDGRHGPGQVLATRAMDVAISKAKASGIGSVWVRNTNDFAMAGNYSMRALADDCIGIVMSNGIPLVAPWGGREALFGTTPVSFAIPTASYDPIVYDGSFAAVSHGAVVLAARDGRRLPGPSLVDSEGKMTDDPVPFIVDPYDRNSKQHGAILPMGGSKGSGWLFLIDILAGVLSGGTTSGVMPFDPSKDQYSTIGQWLMAIDLAHLGAPANFKAKIDDIIRSVKSSTPMEGLNEVTYPGERAAKEEKKRLKDGIPVREEHWENISLIGQELGIPVA